MYCDGNGRRRGLRNADELDADPSKLEALDATTLGPWSNDVPVMCSLFPKFFSKCVLFIKFILENSVPPPFGGDNDLDFFGCCRNCDPDGPVSFIMAL